MISRSVAIPVMAKLVIKGTNSASRPWLARRMITRLARELPGRQVSVTADSAYADGRASRPGQPAYRASCLRAVLARWTQRLARVSVP